MTGNSPADYRRDSELANLREFLVYERLVTLTGTAGIGKTTMAVALAREAAAPAWLVHLAEVEDQDRVGGAIADAVGASQRSHGDPLQRAVARLAAGRNLLVLDNCEHVSPGAGDACVRLLHACPGLSILATSREPLGLPGERVVPVPPLSIPPAGTIPLELALDSDSVRMFVGRAGAIVPGFALTSGNVAAVVEICRRLDGIPLALELAAAWIPVLSPQQVAAQLRDSIALLRDARIDRAARHRTLRAALDWSNRLLTAPEGTAFDRLSVFVGGFDIAAARDVLGPSGAAEDSHLDVMAALVARSLVVADTSQPEARYRLLEPVRQYAAERLADSGEEADARRHHLAHYMAVAEASEEVVLGAPGQDAAVAQLVNELGNIRAALLWGFDAEFEHAARLAVALVWFCEHQGLWQEGVGWALRAMVASGRLKGRAALMAGHLRMEGNDPAAASEHLAAAVAIFEAEGWLPGLAMARVSQACVAYSTGAHQDIEVFAAEGLRLAENLHDDARALRALLELSIAAGVERDYARARLLQQRAMDLGRRLGNRWMLMIVQQNLAELSVECGDIATARQAVRDGLALAQQIGDETICAMLAEDAGFVAIAGGQTDRGLRLVAAQHASRARTGYRETKDEADLRRHWIGLARRRLGPDRAAAVWEAGLALSVEEATAEACDAVADRPTQSRRLTPLSPREAEVAVMVSDGLTTGQVAARLGLSQRTVDNHVQHSLNKLGLASRAQLAAWVARSS